MTARVVLAGIGNELRHDDGAGAAVVQRVAERVRHRDAALTCVVPLGEPLDLLGVWDDCDLAVVVDATHSGAPPGSIRVLELAAARVRADDRSANSTHGLGVASVLRLARVVGHAPRRVVLVGIEGDDFSVGEGLTAPVRRSVEKATDAVMSLVDEVSPCA